jgi:hypothetical protein
MRTLKFIVSGENITQDPSCDFSGLFPGKEDIRAEFSFSDSWEDALKVAGFFSILGNEYEPQVIENNACMIPTEALKYPAFKMQLFGDNGYFYISTKEITIYQGGK